MRFYILLLTAFALLSANGQIKLTPRYSDDPALAKTITLSEVIIPLDELTAKMAKQTGTTFSASREISDLKAAAFIKAMPALDLMNALADTFDLSWERTGDGTAFRYRIYQTQKQHDKVLKLKSWLASRPLREAQRSFARNEALASQNYSDILENHLLLESEGKKLSEVMDPLMKDPSFAAKINDITAEMQFMDDKGLEQNDIIASMIKKIQPLMPGADFKEFELALKAVKSYDKDDVGSYLQGYIAKQMTPDQKTALWNGAVYRASGTPQRGEFKLPDNLYGLVKAHDDYIQRRNEITSGGSAGTKHKSSDTSDFSGASAMLSYDPDEGLKLVTSPSSISSNSVIAGSPIENSPIPRSVLYSFGFTPAAPKNREAMTKSDSFYQKVMKLPKDAVVPSTNYAAPSPNAIIYGSGSSFNYSDFTLLGDKLGWAALCTPYSYIAETDRSSTNNFSRPQSTLGSYLSTDDALMFRSSRAEHTDNLLMLPADWTNFAHRDAEVSEKSIRGLEALYIKQNGLDLFDWINFVKSLPAEKAANLEPSKMVCKVPTNGVIGGHYTSLLRLIASIDNNQRQVLVDNDLPYLGLTSIQQQLFMNVLRKLDTALYGRILANPRFMVRLVLSVTNGSNDNFIVKVQDDQGKLKTVSNSSSLEAMQEWLDSHKDTQVAETVHIRDTSYNIMLGAPQNQPRRRGNRRNQKVTIADPSAVDTLTAAIGSTQSASIALHFSKEIKDIPVRKPKK